MYTISTLIAHNNKDIRKDLTKYINKIEGTKIVGITEDGEKTYKEIKRLKPEIVFIKFDLDKMNSLEIIRKIKRNIDDTPIFNIILNQKIDDNVREMVKIAGKNINSLIQEDGESIKQRINTILKEYREYRNL